MESLYNVGDTVKIKKLSLENGDDYRYGLNDKMVEASGKTFEIESVQLSGYPQCKLPDDGFVYKLKGINWKWVTSMFEGSSKKSTKSKNKKSIKISFHKKKKLKFNFSL